MALGRLALRATVGGLMLGHGLQKLNGSFGGPGLDGVTPTMEAIGMHPAAAQARAAALSETIGGGLTAAGLLSPLGPAMIAGTMLVAALKVHKPKGLWSHAGGYEYNLTLAAAALAIADVGPGPLSVDALLGHRRSGTAWTLLTAGLAAGAAAATLAISDRMAPVATPDAPPAAGSVPAAASAPAEAVAKTVATPAAALDDVATDDTAETPAVQP